jgi:hypothetical protein
MPDREIGDLFTVERFKELVKAGDFIDYDGHGRPVVDGKLVRDIIISPSGLHRIPKGTTHIRWYNR